MDLSIASSLEKGDRKEGGGEKREDYELSIQRQFRKGEGKKKGK